LYHIVVQRIVSNIVTVLALITQRSPFNTKVEARLQSSPDFKAAQTSKQTDFKAVQTSNQFRLQSSPELRRTQAGLSAAQAGQAP
jgi:hypothetical protein